MNKICLHFTSNCSGVFNKVTYVRIAYSGAMSHFLIRKLFQFVICDYIMCSFDLQIFLTTVCMFVALSGCLCNLPPQFFLQYVCESVLIRRHRKRVGRGAGPPII